MLLYNDDVVKVFSSGQFVVQFTESGTPTCRVLRLAPKTTRAAATAALSRNERTTDGQNLDGAPMRELYAIPIRGLGEVKPGDSLAEKLLHALERQGFRLRRGDVLVITHKIVSKAEGQIVPLANVRPSATARRWAARYRLDPRAIELALAESRRTVRMRRGVLITETHHGFVCANSGVDLSNVDGGRSAVLLPRDPDLSAEALHYALKRRLRLFIPIIIADSFGRPWREGLTQVAIGAAGMKVFRDFRGKRDRYGYRLRVTLEAVADELASMAGLAGHKLSRVPACIIRGFAYTPGRDSARNLIRPRAQDLFR